MDNGHSTARLLDESCLDEIANRASTLRERIAAACSQQGAADHQDQTVALRREAWSAAVSGGGDTTGFARRLEWSHIQEDQLPAILSDQLESATDDSAPYVEFLRKLDGGAWSPSVIATFHSQFSDLTETRPFMPFYLPFLVAARDDLTKEVGGELEPAIAGALERALLAELSQLATDSLYNAFQQFRQQNHSLTNLESDSSYRAFLDHLLNCGGADAFFRENSTLARLMSNVTISQVEVVGEMANRLNCDRAMIAQHFFAESLTVSEHKGLGRLTAVSKPLSDRHCNGRRVYSLEFDSNVRIVYKPKDISHEAAFGEFVRKLREDGMLRTPRTPRVLCRDGYGWVEYIQQGSVSSADSLKDYHRTAGTLLALVYLLDGNDCHMENIIATGDGPVLIDVESLLQPRMPAKSSTATFSLAAQRVRHSVLGTGLLPQWQTNRLGVYFDISGYCGAGGYTSAQSKRSWQSPNSDDLSFIDRNPIAAPGENLPTFNGKRHSAERYLDSLVAGFGDACQFIVAHKDRIAAHLKGMFDSPSRLIFRPSTHYGQLLHRSLATHCMKVGVDRSIELERVFRVATGADSCPNYWPLLKQEQEMLEHLDVPYFAMSTSTCDLTLDNDITCQDFLDKSGRDRIEERLASFTDQQINEQIELIRSAFVSPDHMSSLAEVGKGADAIVASVNPVQPDALMASAKWIASSLAASSIRGQDGFATWMAPAYLQPDPQNQRGVSYYVYSGCSGIVLFLAAIESILQEGTYLELIADAIQPIENILASNDVESFLENEGIGGCSGLSSLAYALTCIAQFLDDERYLRIATSLCDHITPERIRGDQSLDIVGGSAGAILSLLTLYRATRDPKALEIAVNCGQHLCAQGVHNSDGSVAWRSNPDGLLLAGFSHGTAGIAMALARLYVASGDITFLDTAWKAILYERTVYDADKHNWPALLPHGNKRFISTWCHGAPGVALGRLGCLDVFPEKEQRQSMLQELHVALDTTVDTGITQIDHLCCGNFGRIDILFTAALQLGDRRLEQIARAGATLVLKRASANKAFNLAADPQRNACFQPGFFRGISGIGYALLRLAHPDQIPSALIWEVPKPHT